MPPDWRRSRDMPRGLSTAIARTGRVLDAVRRQRMTAIRRPNGWTAHHDVCHEPALMSASPDVDSFVLALNEAGRRHTYPSRASSQA
jgi:hypothetical protein